MKALHFFISLILFFTIFPSCSKDTESHPNMRRYETWSSLEETAFVPLHMPKKLSEISKHAFPWAGIVSHHLLADVVIDEYFFALSKKRNVDTFFILSPGHYGVNTETYSLTHGYWAVENGFVETDIDKTERLAKRLKVQLDESAFDFEHGVSTLIPYIKKYFKSAKVVAICYDWDTRFSLPMAKTLAESLDLFFGIEARKENFLLISSDFSHRGDLVATAERDNRSLRFFNAPSLETWDLAACDNRPGIYALAHLGGNNMKVNLIYHTNSFELSNEAPDDITSYFFAYFY